MKLKLPVQRDTRVVINLMYGFGILLINNAVIIVKNVF